MSSPSTQKRARTERARVLQSVLHYRGVSLEVCLRDAPEVEAGLAAAIRGWELTRTRHRASVAPASVIWRRKDGFVSRARHFDGDLSGLGTGGAVCAVLADLAQDFIASHPGCLALHCASFRFAGRLIALTGPKRAGKSTLAARLTAEADMAVFGDDVLPVLEDGQAWSLGMAPRLRLPLPAGVTDRFRSHVERSLGPADDVYGYVCAPTVAPHGARARLGVLVILDRRANVDASLHRVDDGEALHYLLAQNMADLQSAEAAMSRLSALLSDLTCLRLVYSDLEQAVGMMRRAFGCPDRLGSEISSDPAPPAEPAPRAVTSPYATDGLWSSHPDVVLQTKGQSAFLWKSGAPRVWHMNALALAVWTLLEVPGCADELVDALIDAYPDQEPERVLADVSHLLCTLEASGLVLRDRAA